MTEEIADVKCPVCGKGLSIVPSDSRQTARAFEVGATDLNVSLICTNMGCPRYRRAWYTVGYSISYTVSEGKGLEDLVEDMRNMLPSIRETFANHKWNEEGEQIE